MRLLVLFVMLALSLRARIITVAAYNVENLFDADGVAAYADYSPAVYTPAHLRTKLRAIAQVVARMGDEGRGPDVILFSELETDRTPSAERDPRVLLRPFEGRGLDSMLAGPLGSAAQDLPAEAWLLKALEEQGLRGYTVVVGDDAPDAGHGEALGGAVRNAVFTRLPIRSVRNIPIPRARNILELELDAAGHPLHVFANHWKSGADDPASERIRVAGARILRARLDELLAEDPHADILLGGDFNSHYNQRQLHPRLKETALGEVLRSQGDPMAVRGPGADLYNLWHELPVAQRGSDVHRGAWGTLEQLIVSRGLFDENGVQYVEGSFGVVRIPGLNAAGDGTPLRWSFEGPAGSGCSDHFPVMARFRTIETGDRDRWMALSHPSDRSAPSRPVLVRLSKEELARRAQRVADLPAGSTLQDGRSTGRLFLVEGRALRGRRLGVEVADERFDVFVPDPDLHAALRRRWNAGGTVRFYGELGQYRGRWQFVVKDADWVIDDES